MDPSATADRLGGALAIARAARSTLARRWLSWFVRQAIEAGVVHGIRKVEWGPHLDAVCLATQLQLEAWLVANGHGSPEMIQRQREAWERTGATWEDGEHEPWLRYVLVQNQLDNLPPGTLKSTIVMVCANAWIWLWCPTFVLLAASGIDANVTRDSMATRDLVRSAWYRETFAIAWADRDLDPDEVPESDPEIEIRSDSDAISEWATTAGGKRYSRTVARGFTGLHGDGIFIDDPDDADRVWNESARIGAQNRFTRAMENRINDEHRSIRHVLQQVVHALGFSAYLLSIARWSPEKPKGWALLCIPAEYGFQPEDAPRETPYGWRDWRAAKGEVIHPRLTPGVLADKREKLGALNYEGQYNQNARVLVSGWLAVRHARFFVLEGTNVTTLRRRPDGCPKRDEQPPVVLKLEDLDRITLSVDAANSLDPKPNAKVSAVGLTVAGLRGEERFILDDRTRVLGPSATYRGIFELLHAWPIDELLVELKALGAGAIDEVTRSIKRGWYLDEQDRQVPLLGPDGAPVRAVVEPFNPGKDSKEQRAQGAIPPWEQGLIFVRDGAPWLYPQVDESRKIVDEGWIGEVCSFPQSRRNERVDTLTQIVAHYRGKVDPRSRWRAAGRLAALATRRLVQR